MKQHYDSCTDAHTVDTSTTHTAPAVIHVPGQVTRTPSQIALPLGKVQKHHAVTPITLSCKQVKLLNQRCSTDYLYHWPINRSITYM